MKISKTSFEKYHIPTDDREYILGVDEAGRGPVLGPMVYAIAFIPIEKSDELDSLGFKDSKVLTEETRDELFDKVKENAWIGNKYNLNEIAHDTTIHLIRNVFDKIKIKKIIVDTVGPAEKYQEKLKRIFDTDILVTKKADSLYPIVSCASIVAKVTPLKSMFDKEENFGSGYPSDPNTKQWLVDHLDPVFGYPNTVRFSWSTCDTILESKGVAVAWENEYVSGKKRGVFYDSIGLKH
ncbi:Ribonuclease H2 subunit A [Terramyces sp. JEL0728]|nr:Ribonuclease H2 subunit A [Terramyces sp. JEL0728]